MKHVFIFLAGMFSSAFLCAQTSFQPAVVVFDHAIQSGSYQNMVPMETEDGFNGTLVYLNTATGKYYVQELNSDNTGLVAVDSFDYLDDPVAVRRAVDTNQDGLIDVIGSRTIKTQQPDGVMETVSIGGQYFYQASADFNGDGVFDHVGFEFVVGDKEVLVGLSQADGSYELFSVDEGFIFGTNLYQADVDNSGTEDFCYFRSNISSTISCQLGNGDGTFVREDFEETSFRDGLMYFAQLTEGDEFLDLIATRASSLAYLEATSEDITSGLNFAFSESITGDDVIAVEVADMDNDGDQDIITASTRLNATQTGREIFIEVHFSAFGNYFSTGDLLVLETTNSDNGADWQKQIRLAVLDMTGNFIPDIIYNDFNSQKTYFIQNNTVSSTSNLSNAEELEIYPNPVIDNRFRFGVDDIIAIKIFDQLGRTIPAVLVSGTDEVILSNASRGVYYMTGETEKGLIYKGKIIIH